VPECPTVEQAELTSSAAHILYQSLRKLKRLTRRCQVCPNATNCPTRDGWNASIDVSLSQMATEWSGA